MTATPFIDSLSPIDREKVSSRSRGDKRPSYYSASVDRLNSLNQDQRTAAEFQSPDIQISPDFEAVLILMKDGEKKNLVQFINDAFKSEEPDDEVELMTQMVFRRKVSYDQTNTDTYAPALLFEKARAAVLAAVEAKRTPVVREADDPTPAYDNIDAVVPELGFLFAALSTEYLALTKPEILEVHNRIVDAQVLSYYTDEAASRKKELLSWLGVIQTYM